MFDHVGIHVADRAASRACYETLLDVLGHRPSSGELYDEWNDFAIGLATAERPVTEHLHVGFAARSRDEVDAFWAIGTAAGYADDGAPGPRPEYSAAYYGAFLLDPDGNSIEAVHHGVPRTGDDVIDHLWIRVAELEASRRFYAAIAPSLGLELRGERPGRFHVANGARSFALVHGETPTRHVHVAFPAADDDVVARFHRDALSAGSTDNGGPGERSIYHPGYYAAFVLDPDGNSIEAVNHHGYVG